jgi:ketosteroid isomerase-like protein
VERDPGGVSEPRIQAHLRLQVAPSGERRCHQEEFATNIESAEDPKWVTLVGSSGGRDAGPRAQEDAEMAQGTVTDAELAALLRRTAEAASALVRGDVRRYFALLPHADDYTLMSPFGGEPTRGLDASPARLEAQERFFAGPGAAALEVVQAHASGDLAVVAAIERQRGAVGGLPAQDWSLRVTLVFRRDGGGWRLAHRHADPLVHPIGLEQLAALARGGPPSAGAA